MAMEVVSAVQSGTLLHALRALIKKDVIARRPAEEGGGRHYDVHHATRRSGDLNSFNDRIICDSGIKHLAYVTSVVRNMGLCLEIRKT